MNLRRGTANWGNGATTVAVTHHKSALRFSGFGNEEPARDENLISGAVVDLENLPVTANPPRVMNDGAWVELDRFLEPSPPAVGEAGGSLGRLNLEKCLEGIAVSRIRRQFGCLRGFGLG